MKIMLVCASGQSTSFLAAAIRKVAAKRKMDVEVCAHGVSEIEEFVEDIDIVIVAPQGMYAFDQVNACCQKHNVKCTPMNSLAYRMIDGEKLLDDAIKVLEGGN